MEGWRVGGLSHYRDNFETLHFGTKPKCADSNQKSVTFQLHVTEFDRMWGILAIRRKYTKSPSRVQPTLDVDTPHPAGWGTPIQAQP